MAETKSSFIEADLKRFISSTLALVVASSTLYLILFWGRFDISPLQHIGFSDAMPLGSRFLMPAFAVAAFVGVLEVIYPTPIKQPKDEVSYRRYVLLFTVTMLAITFGAYAFADAMPRPISDVTLYAACAAVMPLARALLPLPVWSAVFETDFARRATCFLVVCLPLYAIVMAHSDAVDISARRSYDFVLAGDLKEEATDFAADVELVIIGKLGSVYVLAAPESDDKLLVPPDGFRLLRVRHHKRTSP